jgi:hypothetical protein
MNMQRKSIRGLFLALGLMSMLAALNTVGVAQDAKQPTGITIASLAGPWQLAIVGNAGCGPTSLLFTGTLSSTGKATGTLTSSSGCGVNSASTETLTIETMNSNGSGTANLSCGVACGWNFSIQVAPSKTVFNLVDVTDPVANYLAGTAVKQ